jgi:MFS family permease
MRNSPEEFGLRPDGADAGTIEAVGADGLVPMMGFTPRQALRTPTFWYLSIGHSLSMFVVASVSVHLIPHLTEDLDFTLAQAAGVVSIMTAALMVGQLSGGFLGDRYSKRLIAVCATCGHVAAMATLALATVGPAVIVGAALQGLAHGVRGVQMMPIRADYFGRRSFATIMGFSSLVMVWGVMAGPIFVGLIADRHGDYFPGFWMLASVAAIAVVLLGLSSRPRMPAS